MPDPLLADGPGADARRLVAQLSAWGETVATTESLTAMAEGARTRCSATWGVGLTGVAGPEPHGGHAVGTVFVGVAGPDGTEVRELRLDGNRWDIRWQSVRQAILMVSARLR